MEILQRFSVDSRTDKVRHTVIGLIAIFVTLGSLWIFPSVLRAQESSFDADTQKEIEKINQDIAEKQKEVSELDQKVKEYESLIAEKQKEASSLQSDIAVLDENIQKTETDISATEKRLDILNLELDRLNADIQAHQEKIKLNRDHLGTYLKELYQEEQRTTLETFLSQNNLSEYFQGVQYSQNLQDDARKTIGEIQTLKDELEKKRAGVAIKKSETQSAKDLLDSKKSSLSNQADSKQVLLTATQENEQQYQDLTKNLQREMQEVNSVISNLQQEAENKRNATSGDQAEPVPSGQWVWPTSHRRISARFRDPNYPFRKLFEHNGIDIPMPAGTTLHAVDNGTVAATRFDGLKYAYVILDVGNGVMVVYGHVSKIGVTVGQRVSQGDPLAQSGGIPGAPGTGYFSTGAHLHFETRENGIRKDPLSYLP